MSKDRSPEGVAPDAPEGGPGAAPAPAGSAPGPGAGPPGPSGSAPPAEVPEEALAEARQEAAHYRDRWMRAAAELENFKKWMFRDREDWDARRTAEIFEELLRVRDDFERALAHAPEQPDPVMDGVRLVHRHLVELFERFGVTPIDAVGLPFDPELHDAVLQVERLDVAPHTVVDVALPGYLVGDRVLRHAQVVVSRPAGSPAGEGPSDA